MNARAWAKSWLARVMLINEFCHDCGRRQPVYWAAGDDLWAAVTGRTDGGGVLCPDCFDRRALAQGRLLVWVPDDSPTGGN